MKLNALIFLILSCPACADDGRVQAVTLHQQGATWRINTTVLHPDTGWDHYADAWQVVDENGKQLALRVLAHPHETEQPFTRSQSGVSLPQSSAPLFVNVRCSRDGWSQHLFEVARTK